MVLYEPPQHPPRSRPYSACPVMTQHHHHPVRNGGGSVVVGEQLYNNQQLDASGNVMGNGHQQQQQPRYQAPRRLWVSFPHNDIELLAPPPDVLQQLVGAGSSSCACGAGVKGDYEEQQQQQLLKEWVFDQYKEALLAVMLVRVEDVITAAPATASTVSSSSSNSPLPEEPQQPQQQSRLHRHNHQLLLPDEEEDEEYKEETECEHRVCPNKRNSLSHTTTMDESRRLFLLDSITQSQRLYLQSESQRIVFDVLLEGLLDLMDSDYGFIAELKQEPDGTKYMLSHSSTNIAWDQATRDYYEANYRKGLRFYNLNSLFGHVVLTERPVISNDPSTDSRSAGIPPGHPPMHSFLGLPFFSRVSGHAGEMIGMIGVANKPGGYSQADIEFLEPLAVTCSNLIEGFRQVDQNQQLINTLEQKVSERTQALQMANQSLEEANQRVLQASAAQLQHFACMSHEIRTPLNCIIGLSSLLQETELNPMQEECMRMMVTSGDLLLTVVNDVLDYSKLESGTVDIEIERSNLQETLNSIVHSIELKAQSKNLTLRPLYDVRIPEFVQTDSRRLQQILYNLLGNAIKFSNDNSVVDLMVLLVNADEVGLTTFSSTTAHRGNKSYTILPSGADGTVRLHFDEKQQKDDENVSTTSFASSSCSSSSSSSASASLEGVDDIHPVEDTSSEHEEPRSMMCPVSPRVRRASTGHMPPTTPSGTTSSSPRAPCSSTGAKQSGSPRLRRFRSASPDFDCSIAARTENSTSSLSAHAVVAPPVHASTPAPPRLPASASVATPPTPRVLRFVVKDYGKGIERKDFKRIFKPFLQASAETERVYGGTGLGLAITAKLVHGMGGTIKVDSKVGQWASFTVDLPFDDSPVEISQITDKLQDATIVLVDKPSDTARRVEEIIQDYNVSFARVNDMNEMVNYIEKSRRDENSNQSTNTTLIPRAHICLVHEDLFLEDSLNILERLGRTTLLTIGPHYSVKASAGHFRSLVQVLPSVLMNSLVTYYEDSNRGITTQQRTMNVNVVPQLELRILIAEDNVINQKVLIRMLKRLGLEKVEVVDNGLKAVEREAAEPFDVVLMDMQMPIMDGVTACKHIVSRRGGHPRAPVIFVTAHVSHSFELECLKAGGSGFLPKPFNIREIETCFKKLRGGGAANCVNNKDDVHPPF